MMWRGNADPVRKLRVEESRDRSMITSWNNGPCTGVQAEYVNVCLICLESINHSNISQGTVAGRAVHIGHD